MVAVLSADVILKQFADILIARWAPPTMMGGAWAARNGDEATAGESGTQYCTGLAPHEVSVLEALNFSVSCVQNYCVPNCTADEVHGG